MNRRGDECVALDGRVISVREDELVARLIPDQVLASSGCEQAIPEFESFRRTWNLFSLRSSAVNLKAACSVAAVLGQDVHLNGLWVSFGAGVPRRRYVFAGSMEAVFEALPLGGASREAGVELLRFARSCVTSEGSSLLESMLVLSAPAPEDAYFFEMEPSALRGLSISRFDEGSRIGKKLKALPETHRIQALNSLFQSRRRAAAPEDRTEIRLLRHVQPWQLPEAGVWLFPRAPRFDESLDALCQLLHDTPLAFQQTLAPGRPPSLLDQILAAKAREMDEENSLAACLARAAREHPISAYTLGVREPRALPVQPGVENSSRLSPVIPAPPRVEPRPPQSPPARVEPRAFREPEVAFGAVLLSRAEKATRLSLGCAEEPPQSCVLTCSPRGPTRIRSLPESEKPTRQVATTAVTEKTGENTLTVIRFRREPPAEESPYEVAELRPQTTQLVGAQRQLELRQADFVFPERARRKQEEKTNKLVKKLLENTAKNQMPTRAKLAGLVSKIADKTKTQEPTEPTDSDQSKISIAPATNISSGLDEPNVSAIFTEMPRKKQPQKSHFATTLFANELDDSASLRSDATSISQVSSYFTARTLSHK